MFKVFCSVLLVAALAIVSQANMLYNGTFDEIGATNYKPVPQTAGGWTSWDDGWGNMNSIETGSNLWIHVPDPFPGISEGNYFRTGGLAGQSTGSSGIEQWVTGLTPGESYTLSYIVHYYNGQNTGRWQSGWYEVGVDSLVNTRDGDLALWKVEGLSGTGSWQEMSLNFVAPISGSVNVFIKHGRTEGFDTVLYVDTMVLTGEEVPEPTPIPASVQEAWEVYR